VAEDLLQSSRGRIEFGAINEGQQLRRSERELDASEENHVDDHGQLSLDASALLWTAKRRMPTRGLSQGGLILERFMF
jgi:hypothetical protein